MATTSTRPLDQGLETMLANPPNAQEAEAWARGWWRTGALVRCSSCASFIANPGLEKTVRALLHGRKDHGQVF